jgi:hypothetical protein
MEEIQEDCCSCIFRGMSCAPFRRSQNSDYHYQRNNKLVWDETIQIMVDMFDNVWGDRSEVVVDHCIDITLPVRFLWFVFRSRPNGFAVTFADCPLRDRRRRYYMPRFKKFESHQSILGFGRRVTWTSDLVVPPGHQMTFKDALHILSTNLIEKFFSPIGQSI